MSKTNHNAMNANIVLAHILTKPEGAGIEDIRVAQQALVDIGIADFSPNGTFGPGTAGAVVDYLNENKHLVSRLSGGVKDDLAASGIEQKDLNELSNGFSMSYEPSVSQILSQPYALSLQDQARLNVMLGGAPEGGQPDYQFGPNFREGLAAHIRDNPSDSLQNVGIWDKVLDDAEEMGRRAYQYFLRDEKSVLQENVFTGSREYMNTVHDLVEQATEEQSPTNYRLQMLLEVGGYLKSGPNGEMGPATEKAIEQFEQDYQTKNDSLTFQWKPEGVDQTIAPDVIVGGEGLEQKMLLTS